MKNEKGKKFTSMKFLNEMKKSHLIFYALMIIIGIQLGRSLNKMVVYYFEPSLGMEKALFISLVASIIYLLIIMLVSKFLKSRKK